MSGLGTFLGGEKVAEVGVSCSVLGGLNGFKAVKFIHGDVPLPIDNGVRVC